MFSTNDPRYKDLRRDLRRQQTDVERILWKKLRNSQLDCKFYRQYGVGRYILDFYCHEKKLAIELDGGQHSKPESLEYDKQRTDFLNASGIKVLRFWNNEVIQNLDAVCEKIQATITNKNPLITRGS